MPISKLNKAECLNSNCELNLLQSSFVSNNLVSELCKGPDCV